MLKYIFFTWRFVFDPFLFICNDKVIHTTIIRPEVEMIYKVVPPEGKWKYAGTKNWIKIRRLF